MPTKIVHWEVDRQKCSSSFPRSKFVCQVLKNILKNAALKGRLMQTSVHCKSAQMSRATEKLLKCLGYNCFSWSYSPESEEKLKRKEVQTEVGYCMLVQIYGQNDVLTISEM